MNFSLIYLQCDTRCLVVISWRAVYQWLVVVNVQCRCWQCHWCRDEVARRHGHGVVASLARSVGASRRYSSESCSCCSTSHRARQRPRDTRYRGHRPHTHAPLTSLRNHPESTPFQQLHGHSPTPNEHVSASFHFTVSTPPLYHLSSSARFGPMFLRAETLNLSQI